MERVGYKIVLNFANFYGVEVEKREINGIMEDVMVVPLRLNGFYVSKKRGNKGVYLYGKALPSDINPYNQSHYLVSAPNVGCTIIFEVIHTSYLVTAWYTSLLGTFRVNECSSE